MPFFGPTTRMPQGVTNAAPWQTMGQAGVPDPTWNHTFTDDFDKFLATDYTTTLVGAGTNALAVGYQGGGLASFTAAAGIADAVFNQLAQAGFQAAPLKDTFFKWSGQLSEVVNCVMYAGLIIKSTTPLAAADGIYFLKATGQAAFVLRTSIGGVNTDLPLPASAVAVAATDFELGFHVDPAGNIEVFFNPSTGNARPAGGSVPVALGRLASATNPALITQTFLSPSFGLLNSTAVARTLTTDYVVASRAR
jgi:hypothetical protein